MSLIIRPLIRCLIKNLQALYAKALEGSYKALKSLIRPLRDLMAL